MVRGVGGTTDDTRNLWVRLAEIDNSSRFWLGADWELGSLGSWGAADSVLRASGQQVGRLWIAARQGFGSWDLEAGM